VPGVDLGAVQAVDELIAGGDVGHERHDVGAELRLLVSPERLEDGDENRPPHARAASVLRNDALELARQPPDDPLVAQR
jgi:hypothetical protein